MAKRNTLGHFFVDARMVTKKFVSAVKNRSGPQYQLAWEAGIHPVTLTQIVTGYLRPKPGDQLVLKVAKILGLSPSECFQEKC